MFTPSSATAARRPDHRGGYGDPALSGQAGDRQDTPYRPAISLRTTFVNVPGT
jgi:hypothetical protein